MARALIAPDELSLERIFMRTLTKKYLGGLPIDKDSRIRGFATVW